MGKARALPVVALSGRDDEPRVRIPFRRTILAGVAVAALTFGGFGTWAALAPLSSAVVAEGVFKVSSERKEIQHPDGGVVREILVTDGQVVAAGDVLIRLDDTQARANVDTLQVGYDEARARLARLQAERVLRSAIRFPDDLVARRSEDPDVEALLRSEEDLFRARRQALAGTIDIIEEMIAQLQRQIEGIDAQLEAKEREAGSAREELAGVRDLLDDGLVEKTRVSSLEREVARLDGDIGVLESERARLATEISEEELRSVQTYSDMRETVVEELRETNTQLAELQTRMRDAKYVLDNTVVRAPDAGVVMEMAVHTLGGVIRPGETVLQLVPEGDSLLLEARLGPADIDNLVLGQPARVRLVGLRHRDAPVVDGELVYLSADRITDESGGPDYYLARVELEPSALGALESGRILAGMPADLILETGERTALDYLSQPIVQSIERAWREE